VSKKEPLLLAFKNGKSNFFKVARIIISDIDTLELRVTAQGDYSEIDGFLFNWTFASTNVQKYQNSGRLWRSILIVYMFVIFLIYLKLDAEIFTQVFLIILGVLGLFASNPLGVLFPSEKLRVADHFLPAIFNAVYRMFLILEIILLATRKSTPPPILVLALVFIFGCYITIEAFASYDRSARTEVGRPVAPAVLKSERAEMWWHTIYVLISGLCFVGAGITNDGSNFRRLVFFGCSLFLSGTVTLVTKVYAVRRLIHLYSMVPGLIYSAVHSTLTAMALFFMHHTGGVEYKGLDNEVPGAANTGLDIEQISEGEDSEDGFRGEDPEHK
jgi:hypothetical protein